MRTVLISGANRGLGLEFARQYLAAGDKVIAGARDPDAARELKALPGQDRLALHPLDVGDGASVQAFRRAVGEQPIDILIANAGVMGGDHQDRLAEIDWDAWLDAFAVNTLGPARLAQAFADRLAAGRDRKLIAVTSRMGSTADSSGGHLIYRSSKCALTNVWHNLAIELKDRGITCIPVHPGWVRTDMGGAEAPLTPEQAISSLRAHVDRWTLADSGRFLSWDGAELPW
jgi:NAD(P)-dependent dehydrogenase (short-subunit alcohol dehydrogenase family)